jgi:hypothetical protein
MAMLLWKHIDTHMNTRTESGRERKRKHEAFLATLKASMHRALSKAKVQRSAAFVAMMQKAMPLEKYEREEQILIPYTEGDYSTLCAPKCADWTILLRRTAVLDALGERVYNSPGIVCFFGASLTGLHCVECACAASGWPVIEQAVLECVWKIVLECVRVRKCAVIPCHVLQKGASCGCTRQHCGVLLAALASAAVPLQSEHACALERQVDPRLQRLA